MSGVLTGTIRWVGPKYERVTLVGPRGARYDFLVGIVKRSDLNNELQKQATVHFLPKKDSDVAERIYISTS